MLRATATTIRSTIVLGLAVVAVAAPTAQARIAVDPPGASAGEVGIGPVRLEDRADRPTVVATSNATAPDATPAPRSQDPASSDGFDWWDALVGVGIGVAAAGLALAVFLLSRRHIKSPRRLVASESELR